MNRQETPHPIPQSDAFIPCPEPIRRWLTHGPMDMPGPHAALMANLPSSPEELVKLVQNAFIHQHVAKWVHGVDVPRDRFLTAPVSWELARSGKEDPGKFGIFKWWGFSYLNCNLMLDINSLCNLPMQPWDSWPGFKESEPETWTDEDWEALDTVALLAQKVDTDFEAFSRFLEENGKMRVPEDPALVVNMNLQRAPGPDA